MSDDNSIKPSSAPLRVGAPSNDPPAVDTAAPTTQHVPLIVNYAKRGEGLLNRTLGKLNVHGHKDPDLQLEIKNKILETAGVIDVVMANAEKFVVDKNGGRCLPLTALNPNKKLWGKTGSYLFLLGDRKKVGAAFSESEGGFYVRIMDQFDEEEQELKDDNAFVIMTLDDMKQLAEEYSELKKIVMELMQICPAFSGFYNDTGGHHRKKLFEHCLIAVFETYFASVIDGSDPGYIAERILNLGSEAIWRYLTPPSPESNNKTAIDWLTVLPDDLQLYVLETWEHFMSAIRSYIRDNDMTNSDEVMAMLRDDLYQWYLNRHILYSIWGHGGPNQSGTCLLGKGSFPDALSCPIFAEVKAVAKSILQVMEQHTNGELTEAEARSRFDSFLKQIASNHTKAYVVPSDEALREGGVKMLNLQIEEAEAQPKRTALIFTEKFLVDKYNKDYWGDITRGAVTCDVKTVMPGNDGKGTWAGTLYKIPLDGVNCKTLLIFVGCSPHVTLGYGASMPQRLSQASKQIATSSVLEEAGLIDEGSTDKLVKRFRFFFINAEGPFGNLLEDVPDSKREVRFYFAVMLTLPPGYYISPIRTGVVALANEICPGMLKHHAVALMVIMGYEQFQRFVWLHCGLELGPAANLEGKLEKMSRQRRKLLAQQKSRAHAKILEILQKKAEARTEEDFEILEESRALLDSRRIRRTSQLYDDAKMLIMTLDEDSSEDDFSKVAEGLWKLLTDHVTYRKFFRMKRFYREVAVDFEKPVMGRLTIATKNICLREENEGEASANDNNNVFHQPSDEIATLISGFFDSTS